MAIAHDQIDAHDTRDTRVAAVEPSRRRGIVAMVLATTSWGFSTVANKMTLNHTDLRPASQLAIQLAASVIVLGVAVGLRGKRPSRMAWRVGRSGMLEPGASYVLALIGLSMTAASHAAIIGSLEPAFVVVGAWLVLRARVARATVALMTATLIGAVLVVTGASGGESAASAAGDLLLVASVVCAAGYVLLSSHRAGTVEPLTAVFTQQVWALLVVAPVLVGSIVTGGFGPLPHGNAWLFVVISSLLGYVIPFVLYLSALESIPGAIAAQYLALIPLCGMIGAATFLGERLSGRAVIGGAIVVGSLFVLSRRPTSNEVD